MKNYSFLEIYSWAKEHSPFYRELYGDCDPQPVLEKLPIVDSMKFWAANVNQNNQILTNKNCDGIVFKSGGTTGRPKFSYFSKEEWETFTKVFGDGMTKGGLMDGERLANLFYAGDLYASFLFIMKSIEYSPKKVLQFPLSGSAESDSILKTIDEFKVTTWAGVPTTIMKVAEQAKAKKVFAPQKILFGGESFYPDQREHLGQLFPGIKIQSIGCASVDGGLIGYVDATCKEQEHRVFSDSSIIEIVDEESGKAIHQPHVPGKILLTNLTRKLMPIIRYPVGDRGEWVDSESVTRNRKFKILGRSEEGARVGPATVYYDDVAAFLHKYVDELNASGFQLVVKHFEEKDQLILRIAREPQDNFLVSEIASNLEAERTFLKELADAGKIHRPKVEFIKASELVFQSRTGKLKRIIDERF